MPIDFNELNHALSKNSKRTNLGILAGLIGVAIGLIGFGTNYVINDYTINKRRQNPDFPPTYITRNLDDVQKPDGTLEETITIPAASNRKYEWRVCQSKSDNPSDPQIVCMYDLGGKKGYFESLEYADEIYREEINGKN